MKRHFWKVVRPNHDSAACKKGVLELNKDDFSSVDDIQDAIGAILGELGDDRKSHEDINDICLEFMNILHM